MNGVPTDKEPINQEIKTQEHVDLPDVSKPNTGNSFWKNITQGFGNLGNTLKGKSPAPAAAAAGGGTKGGKRKTKKGKKSKKSKQTKSKRSRK